MTLQIGGYVGLAVNSPGGNYLGTTPGRNHLFAGIPVVLATDAGNPFTLHGGSVFMALEAIREAGLSPVEVLVAATPNGTRAIGLGQTGTVTAGSVADMVVLDAGLW